jgi:hypothetical protein
MPDETSRAALESVAARMGIENQIRDAGYDIQ